MSQLKFHIKRLHPEATATRATVGNAPIQFVTNEIESAINIEEPDTYYLEDEQRSSNGGESYQDDIGIYFSSNETFEFLSIILCYR